MTTLEKIITEKGWRIIAGELYCPIHAREIIKNFPSIKGEFITGEIMVINGFFLSCTHKNCFTSFNIDMGKY